VGGIQRFFNILGGRARGAGIGFAVDGRDNVEILAFDRGDKLSTDEIVVLGLVGDFGTGGAGSGINGH